jgi:energy-coupling factor transport system substrate-specific component
MQGTFHVGTLLEGGQRMATGSAVPARDQRAIPFNRFTTWDLVTIVLVTVVSGVLSGTFSALWAAMFAAGGTYFANIVLGIFYIGPLIAGYLVRKPGAATLGGLIQGVVSLVAGTPFGFMVVVWSTTQGFGIDLAYALFRYRKWGWLTVSVAAFLAFPVTFPWNFWYFGLAEAPWWGIPPYFYGAILAIPLAGWLGKAISDAVARTGVLRGLAIGQET